jgi:type VI secretion system protein ImpK
MSAELCSTSLMGPFVVPGTHQVPSSYYRSKLFRASYTSNSFLAAAGPLFSLLERLGTSHTLPPIETVIDNLEHELKAFRSRLNLQKNADEHIVIAQYLMSSTMDELLGKCYLRVQENPAEFQAFTPSSHDGVGPERRFFDIVDHLKTRPNQYLDLIELAYYCLISGFEGEQHLNTVGRQTLDNLIEELHELIQKNRVSKPLRLFTEPQNPTGQVSVDHKPWLKTTGLVCAVLLGSYMISQTLLEHQAKRIMDLQFQSNTSGF